MRRLSLPVISGLLFAVAALPLSPLAHASDRHMRKYKSPPPMAQLEVTVLKNSTGEPLHNVAVVFHPLKDSKDQGDMELKTNEEGKATLNIIPIGTKVMVQVVAPGYRTFGREYDVTSDEKHITIKLVRPDQQYSIYTKAHPYTDIQTNTPQAQMGHAAPADSPLLPPAPKKH